MKRRKIAIGVVILAVVATAGFFAFGRASGKNGTHKNDGGRTDTRTVVRTVRPRLDSEFRISNQQIAVVEPFYQAPLRARAAGLVRTVRKEMGERVSMGELLVEIDAPDLEQDLEQKEAVIRQRRQELQVSKAMLKHATAAVETAAAAIAQRTAESRQAAATRDFKQSLLTRLQGLLKDNAVRAEAVYEAERDYLASEAAYEAAKVGIQKAKADQVEKQASLEAAQADVKLKDSLIAVAEKDRDKAAAAAGFARIVAPFDGVIVRRNVDPGMFVQNATSGPSEPLITVARVDLVTVSMKLPDVAAPFISRNTDVEVTVDDLPGLTIRGKVTRYSPAIDGADRTMRVELDIFNGTRADFQAFLANTYAEAIAPLGGGTGLGTAAAVLAAERHRQLFRKGVSDGTAVCLDVPAGSGLRPLVPGMSAMMRVYLDRVSSAYLLPSSAVFSQGGKTYIMLVRDEVTRQVPVRVQVNDGRMAKVALLAANSAGVHELTGNEEVVVSRQLEVGDGAKVRTVAGDW
jgi:multidrug efflux pump subunit AcrA (membrane-fusion protein)